MSSAGTAREVLAASLRLGLTAFGGPIAHLGYQRRAFVDERGWLSEAAFAELVALVQTLPGPASSQLSIAVGRIRAGWAGALAAWVGFTLPSAVAMTLLGLWAAGAGIPTEGPVAGAIAGLKVAAVAVVLQAVVTMGRRLTPDAPRLVLAAVAALVTLAVASPFAQAAVIAAGGVAGWLAWGRGRATGAYQRTRAAGESAGTGEADRPAGADIHGGVGAATGGRGEALVLGAAFVAVVVGSQLLATASGDPGAGFVAAIVRAGALVFGGGHVVLPLLDAGVVAPGWVGEGAFLAGYGAAQAVPGPLFTFASYLGAVSDAEPGGIAGAALATVAIFLPGALLVLAALPVIGALRERPGLAAALQGVNASVVGVLAAALVSPVATSGLTSPLAVVVAGAGAVALFSGRVPPILVVAASATVLAAASV